MVSCWLFVVILLLGSHFCVFVVIMHLFELTSHHCVIYLHLLVAALCLSVLVLCIFGVLHLFVAILFDFLIISYGPFVKSQLKKIK